MGVIPQFKTGNCKCGCNGKNVSGRKVGKDFYCMDSYRAMKTKQYTRNANQKSKVRGLLNKQVQDGNYEDASIQALKLDLDWVVSRYVRILYSDENGLCKCFTCDALRHFTFIQNGHFIPRSNMATRWLLKNLRPQCQTCNEVKHGNLEVFSQRLEEDEKGLVEYLKELSRETYKFGVEELKQMLYDFRAKLKIIELKLKK